MKLKSQMRLGLVAITLIIIYVIMQSFWGEKEILKNEAPFTVTVVYPSYQQLPQFIRVTGMTVAQENIIITSELSGVRIVDVFADVGSMVKKDQVLAQLDIESLEHKITEVSSDYERLKDEYNRVDAIKNSGAISQELLVQKRTAMQAAQAKLRDAQLNLERGTIRSPVDGVILQRSAEIGALVNANASLYQIAENGIIEVTAQVPESELMNIKLEQQSVVHLSGIATAVHGHVRLIELQIDTTHRTSSVRIQLDAAPQGLPVGLFSQIEINTGEEHGFLLPATALQQDLAGYYVWQLDAENKAQRFPVDVIVRNHENVLVADLAKNIPVVARAGSFLKQGQHVNITQSP